MKFEWAGRHIELEQRFGLDGLTDDAERIERKVQVYETTKDDSGWTHEHGQSFRCGQNKGGWRTDE